MTNHIPCIIPTRLNKLFISYTNGGLSLFQPRDARTGYVLPNCTSYAESCFNHEVCMLTGIPDTIIYSFDGNAENWYKDAVRLKLERGDTPREGAMMCWSGGKGHVAIVDKIYEDGRLRIYESSYSAKEDFEIATINNKNGRWGMSSAYKFEGFVYNPMVKTISPIQEKTRCKVKLEAKEHIRVTLRNQDWVYTETWLVEKIYSERALIRCGNVYMNIKKEYLEVVTR